MDEARAEFLRHKDEGIASLREGRQDEARTHFLAAAKAALALAQQVKSPSEKATLMDAAQTLTAKANELKAGPAPASAPADRAEPTPASQGQPGADGGGYGGPPTAAKIDPSIFLASAPGQAMRAQILAALASALPLSAEVDLSALAAETQGMGGPDLLALLADACRRAQRACVGGRAEWCISAEDIAAALAHRATSPTAPASQGQPGAQEGGHGGPPRHSAQGPSVITVDTRVQEALTTHGLPPEEAAAFEDLLALTQDRQLLGELLADRAREVKARLAKRHALEILKPYITTLDRGVLEHLLAEILGDPLSIDPAKLDADLRGISSGQAEDRLRELQAAARRRFEETVDSVVGAITDASLPLRRKLARKAKRLLSPTLDAASLRAAVRDLRVRLAAFYEGQKKEGEEPKDPIAHVEDLVLDVCPVDYDDVAGMDAVKRALEFAIESPLRDHEVILRATGRPPENTGILLYGPPGCGKTFIALAAAGEFRQKHGVTVISVPLEAVLALHWSKQVERIVDIFELARKRAPSIVIWDEFDTYASDPRVTNRKYDEKLCTTFKQQFEGVMKSEKPIIHVATSNYPWKLEIPLLRPGRLGDIQYIPPPDLSARRELFEVLLGGANVEEGVDLAELATKTDGAVSAEIKAVVRKALEAPVKEYIERGRKDPLRKATMEDLRAALAAQNVGQFAAWLRLAEQEINKERFLPVQPLFQALQQEVSHLQPPTQ